MTTIQKDYTYRNRNYVKVTFTSPEHMRKYDDFLRHSRERDPIPRGIYFHEPDEEDDTYYVLLEPNWLTLKDWLNAFNNVTNKFWKFENGFCYFNDQVKMVMKDIIYGLQKSHKKGFYSGQLTVENFSSFANSDSPDKTGIFISNDGEAIAICPNCIIENRLAWSSQIEPVDQMEKMKLDLVGFKLLFEHLLQRFVVPVSAYAREVETLQALYTDVFPKCAHVVDFIMFETYVRRASLFWSKSDRHRFCEFMDYFRKKWPFSTLDFSDSRSSFESWDSQIQPTSPLYQILRYQNNYQGYSSDVYSVGRFVRNAIHHLGDVKGIAYTLKQTEAIICNEMPDVLTKLYFAIVLAYGVSSRDSANFYNFFMDAFE